MSKLPIVINEFSGGQAASIKQGTPNSFAYSRHLDFRKDPMSLTVLPSTTKDSGTTVTDLITDMIQLPSGLMVAIDKSGGVYKRTAAGVWSKEGTSLPDTAYGMVYNLQHDTIYIPGLTTMHSISNADGRFTGGTFTVNSNTFSAVQDLASSDGHTNTYTVLTSISETSTDLLSIVPNVEPLYSVKIWVTSVGTGDITVTMHDAADHVLGSSTVVHADLTAGAYNEFVLDTPARMLVKPNGGTYHFHITVSTGSTTVGTKTSSDFSTADYESYSNRFVEPNNGFHPVCEFLQYILIGNERYVAVWEPISVSDPLTTEFLQHRLTFPSGYEVTSMAVYNNNYVAIACEKRSSTDTSVFNDGKIFFWDGTSVTYNDILDVPEGSPYGLFSHKNVLYYFAGGSWWAYGGSTPVKFRQMPNTDFEFTDTSTYMVNYPNTMAVRNGILLGAFPSETNSTNIEHALYSYGQREKNYPYSFGYSYSMSTGTRTNGTLRLGMVKSFGDKTFLSWRDDTSYGVDIIGSNSDPFSSFTWESLISDMMIISKRVYYPRPDKDKMAISLTIAFNALPTGCTVTPKYKINRADSWTSGVAATEGDTTITLNINKRYKEIQFGLDGTCGSITPDITGIILVVEMLVSEAD